MEKIKKERTIRSETTKVFLIIFSILVIVGTFTIGSSIIGSNNFVKIRDVHLKQFRAAEVMKARALEIIAIYYLLATDQDQEVLMRELKRYDGLVESFDQARLAVIKTYKTEGPEKKKILNILNETKIIFDDLNNSCRRMTFSMMNGDKKASAAEFPNIDAGIKKFQGSLNAVEAIVGSQLDHEAEEAQFVFKQTTNMGIGIIILAVFITLGLIYYLMKFLSISLLPISNLMHNMRQAVFSIDKDLNVISPVSAYSSVVFGEDIVDKNVSEIIFKETDKATEAFSRNKMAMDVVFGADDLQWMLQEDGLMRQVVRKIPADGSVREKILKLSYTPLMNKDIVENIMIVAEDVTEIEALKAESKSKQVELEIIKSVIEMDPYELRTFLNETGEQLGECWQLMDKLQKDPEARLSLFRVLHTQKGNSRMYKLNAISEVVHQVEGTVSEIRMIIDSGEAVSEEKYTSLKNGLAEIEKVLELHWKMSAKIFKHHDLGEVKNGEPEREITIHSVCEKIEPMVCELSQQMGKNIDFAIEGDNVVITPEVARSLRDALNHIVRNCLDHGIEVPEERALCGKNLKAKLEIKIKRKDKGVEIIVRDDGRGIDAEKLVNKALSLGVIQKEEALNLSHEERLQLIFIPNLSTKEEVTDISGRGVGMDAVKNTIHQLGGKITVFSNNGVGTEFKMCI